MILRINHGYLINLLKTYLFVLHYWFLFVFYSCDVRMKFAAIIFGQVEMKTQNNMSS